MRSLSEKFQKQAAASHSMMDAPSSSLQPSNQSHQYQKWNLDVTGTSNPLDLHRFWQNTPSPDDIREWILKLEDQTIVDCIETLKKDTPSYSTLSEDEKLAQHKNLWTIEKMFSCIKDVAEAYFEPSVHEWGQRKVLYIYSRYRTARNISDPKVLAAEWMMPLRNNPIQQAVPATKAVNIVQLRESFREPYRDDNGFSMKDFVKKSFMDYARKWNLNDFFSPYTTLAQSSGCGKSRTVKELGAGDNPKTAVFFICFRCPGSSGYPLRSFVADLLTGNLLSLVKKNFRQQAFGVSDWTIILAFYCAFFTSCLTHLRIHIEEKDWKSWMQEQYDDDIAGNGYMGKQFWLPILHESLSMLDKIFEYAKSKKDKETRKNEVATVYASAILKCAIGTLHGCAQALREQARSTDLKLTLFAFDEASELIGQQVKANSYFHYLRYALATFPKGDNSVQQKFMNFFAVMIDTQTSIANFSPSVVADPSLRFITSTRLYEPLYLVGWWNSNLLSLNEFDTATKAKVDCFLKKNAVFAGRYLWQSLGKDVEDCIATAAVKLLGAVQLPRELKRNHAMALLGARYSVFFNCGAQFLTEICRSHLASVFYIDRDKDSDHRGMMVGYPSEPIVALASAWLSHNYEVCGPVILVRELSKQIKKGAVEAGFRGELTAKVLLLLARDLLTLGTPKTRGTNVETQSPNQIESPESLSFVFEVGQFLKMLGGTKVEAVLSESKLSAADQDRFMKGLMSFNHFVYVDDDVLELPMELYFNRGAAIFCKRGQTGCDLIIPVLLDLNPIQFSYILISVKNYSNKSTEAQLAPFKTSAERVGISGTPVEYPYMILFMDVGPNLDPETKNLDPRPSSEIELRSSDNRYFKLAVGLVGLSKSTYPFLDSYPGLLEELTELSTAWMSPMLVHQNHMDRRILSMMLYGSYQGVLNEYLKNQESEPDQQVVNSSTKRQRTD